MSLFVDCGTNEVHGSSKYGQLPSYIQNFQQLSPNVFHMISLPEMTSTCGTMGIYQYSLPT